MCHTTTLSVTLSLVLLLSLLQMLYITLIPQVFLAFNVSCDEASIRGDIDVLRFRIYTI